MSFRIRIVETVTSVRDLVLSWGYGIVGAVAAAVLFNAIFDRIERHKPQETLEERIKVLTLSLTKSASTIQEIETEIKNRQALVAQLQQDAETARRLTALNKEQVDAVAQVLRGQIEAQEKKSFWINQSLAIFYTLLGVALGEVFRRGWRWWKVR